MKLDFDKALEFVKKHHAGQCHANDVPVWHHLARVSKRLEFILEHTQEGSVDERKTLVVAALGHDLLEDTKVSEREVEKVFGKQGLQFILGMTNTWGDDNVAPYVEKVSRASEEVRLIKLADLCDNITSVTYNLAVLGEKWTNSYFLPIVTPMKEAVVKTSFEKYKKAGEGLVLMVNAAFSLLKDELSRWGK